MVQKSTTFTTIFRVKKYHFHYDMQIKIFNYKLEYPLERIPWKIVSNALFRS
jgi:hypothetical protein